MMTMLKNSNLSLEQLASTFIVGASQMLPGSFQTLSASMYISANTTCRVPVRYALFCGSSEEFYIRPINPCITDVDALYYDTDKLAFADVITAIIDVDALCYETDQLAFACDAALLPRDVSILSDMIQCYKIEPCLQYPGFVRLTVLGKMIFNWKNKIFQFTPNNSQSEFIKFYKSECTDEQVLLSDHHGEKPDTMHGPAITIQRDSDSVAHDKVRSIWCPQFPKEARNWSKRRRDYGWPTNEIINELVRYGCHVVYVQHRACRDDELQWRYSFSVAEVVLLQTWTYIQQVVYHLLRYFAKRELIRKDCPKEDEILCIYHLKTLMLWTCEQMPPEWWNSSSVIAICCELLIKLLEMLKKRFISHYFIPEANLFYIQLDSVVCEEIQNKLESFCSVDVLCNWFVTNYILPYTRRHFNVNASRETTPHFMEYLLTLSEFRKASDLQSLDFLFSIGFAQCNVYARDMTESEDRIDPRACLRNTFSTRKFELLRRCEMSTLPIPENVWDLAYFDAVLYSLNAAFDLLCGRTSWDSEPFAEYVNGIFEVRANKFVGCRYHIFPKPLTAEKSQFHFMAALELMNILTGDNSRSVFQLVFLISQEMLKKALECDDSQSSIVAPAALVYLAALQFAQSHSQIVIDLCSAVLMDTSSHSEKETLDASCLFFIDDIVRSIGLCLLCLKLKENKQFSGRRINLDLRVTPKLFAHYLIVLSADKEQLEVNLYLPNSAFPMDRFLLGLIRQQSCTLMNSSNCSRFDTTCMQLAADSHLLRANSLIEKEKVISALTEHALDKMTLFYNTISEDYGLHCNTADCYRALYLYKCRKYDEVQNFCERILLDPDTRSDLTGLRFENVWLLPPLDAFFDEDIQSLLGFHTLFYYLSSPNLGEDLGTLDVIAESTIAQFVARAAHSSKNQLSHSLGYPFSIKCHYVLGKHFLARYLKFRCYIDCNHQPAEAMDEFITLKCNLPFEFTLKHFIMRKFDPDQKNPTV